MKKKTKLPPSAIKHVRRKVKGRLTRDKRDNKKSSKK